MITGRKLANGSYHRRKDCQFIFIFIKPEFIFTSLLLKNNKFDQYSSNLHSIYLTYRINKTEKSNLPLLDINANGIKDTFPRYAIYHSHGILVLPPTSAYSSTHIIHLTILQQNSRKQIQRSVPITTSIWW